ncbi:hypothetical protein ABS772_23725 [Methylorubrum podarium]|uniref:Uncharacterized protein n=1 Tax=Methylorubrum podarium TaxID=200476 RepID=A0ABV1QU26_9HYPH
MSFSNPGGWRERVKRTAAKAQARDDMAEIRAARAGFEAEKQRLADEQNALDAESLRLSRLRCPCCDGDGSVTPIHAELVYRALERLPSESKPDPEHIASLAAIALRQPVHGRTPRIVHGVHHPAPIALVELAATMPVTVKKANKVNKFPDDGALIEIDD